MTHKDDEATSCLSFFFEKQPKMFLIRILPINETFATYNFFKGLFAQHVSTHSDFSSEKKNIV
jgi:hypothetical protein